MCAAETRHRIFESLTRLASSTYCVHDTYSTKADRVKIGLCFPYAKGDLTRALTLEWFRRVDEGPFSALSCGERVVGTSIDMMALMAAAAAVTERVRIVPTLYILPMHPAIHVAKHAATLDLISGGRTTITVGIGGRMDDYKCMEIEPVRRYARLDEQVAEVRRTPQPGRQHRAW